MSTLNEEILGFAPTLVFLHIPKTAGQSLIRAFTEIYPESDAFAFYPDVNGNPLSIQGYKYDIHSNLPPRIVVGHFSFGSIDRILGQDERRWITFLRDPLDRLKSQYLFDRDYLFSNIDTRPEAHDLIFSLSPLEYIRKSNNWVYDNCITRMISGVGGSVPIGSINRVIFDMAIRNADKLFFVGFQHCYEKSLKRLTELFGFQPLTNYSENIRASLNHENKFPVENLVELNEGYRWNIYDYQLYYYCLEKWG